MRLKQKRWKVSISLNDNQQLTFTGLDVEFEIKRSMDPEPNSCQLTVFNLSPTHRAQIEAQSIYEPKRIKGAKKDPTKPKTGRKVKSGRIFVSIEAGYEEGTSLVFRGSIRRAISTKEGETWKTVIEGEDGGHSMLAGRINEEFSAGTTKAQVVRACADAMGLGLGNFQTVVQYLQETYDFGTIVTGQPHEELSRICRGAKLSWSIQNGVLQFLPTKSLSDKTGLTTVGFVLSKTTGMVNAPHKDCNGRVEVQTLMLPDVAPGSYVRLASQGYQGTYLVRDIETKGSSSGNDWGHTLSVVPA